MSTEEQEGRIYKMFWEIIKKNKRKSVIALAIMTFWYVLIYGAVCGLIILSFTPGSIAEELMDKYYFIVFASGAAIALCIFLIQFFLQKNKPYKMSDSFLYRVNKRTNTKLYNIAEETAIAAGQNKMPKLYVLDSDILNAYACGINPEQSSIVVSKGLLEILSRDELQGVIAHEMSHIVNRDTTYLLCSGLLFAVSAGFTAFFWSCARRGRKGSGFFALLALISLIGQGICFILFMFISRKREYLADACAAVYTRYPKGLADALIKIEKASKSNNIYDNTGSADNLIKASFIVPEKKKGRFDNFKSTRPLTENRIKILLNMTSADFTAYEREFEAVNRKSLLPSSALADKKIIPIKEVKEKPAPPAGVSAACALSAIASDTEEIKIIKENRKLLEENIQKHREIENLVRNLAGYTVINCNCRTKLKIPPVYKNQIIICPHCGKKHIA